MNLYLKTACKTAFLLVPLLAGCVSIELPHVVEDTANLGKNAYQAMKAKRQPGNALAHSYVGSSSQTTTDIRQHCEAEAARKLREMNDGKEQRYTVLDNEIVIINGNVAANCRVVPLG